MLIVSKNVILDTLMKLFYIFKNLKKRDTYLYHYDNKRWYYLRSYLYKNLARIPYDNLK